jgi:branched-subunit amino acid aminotransferase/4-amino-4-deoxychorismate lyase
MNEKNIKHSETTVILVDDVLKADEAFIASANRDLIPVTSIDGKKIGSGKIGSSLQATDDVLYIPKKFIPKIISTSLRFVVLSLKQCY